jgi:hypothetical protein
MEKIYMGDICFYLCISDLLLIILLQYFSCNFVIILYCSTLLSTNNVDSNVASYTIADDFV